MQSAIDQLGIFITTYGLKIIGAIIILVLGRIGAGIGRGIVKKTLGRSKIEPAVISFVCGLT